MKLAELPTFSGALVRFATLFAATALWIIWTVRYAVRTRVVAADGEDAGPAPAQGRDLFVFALMLLPMAAYVYGSMALGWGFNELSAGFFIGGIAAGLVGGLGLGGTIDTYLEGMKGLLPAALMVGVARSISVVLADGKVIDTILNATSVPLSHVSAATSAILMVPFHVLIHIVVSSVSGHAVLTMPVLVPLSDLVGISRQVTVLAYQTGAGLTELLTPTNGSLMAILLAAGVPFVRWFRFAIGGALLAAAVGLLGMMAIG